MRGGGGLKFEVRTLGEYLRGKRAPLQKEVVSLCISCFFLRYCLGHDS